MILMHTKHYSPIIEKRCGDSDGFIFIIIEKTMLFNFLLFCVGEKNENKFN